MRNESELFIVTSKSMTIPEFVKGTLKLKII